jgi:hypothetical protein
MARPTQVWTMGWRVPRAERGLGVEVVVWHTVPPLDGLLCCARCPHHGRPRLCCGVERAGRALVRCAGCCAPGRRVAPAPCPAVGREKPTRLRENAWKFRGSRVCFPVRETNTASQGKRLRRCLFLLFGSTESEAVFVSFVWVNSCRKD